MTDKSGFPLTNHPTTDHYERPRGIFTPKTDRPFLVNHEDGPNDRAEYTRHEDIRERLLHGIVDFQLAHRHLDEWNWKKFLESDTVDERELRNGMAAAIALFYEIHHEKDWSFSNTLNQAVEDAYSTGASRRTMPQRRLEEVDFEVDAREYQEYGTALERVSQKIVENAELTDSEVAFAVRQGWYDVLDDYFAKENRRERSREDFLKEVNDRISFGDFEEYWENKED